MITRKNTRQNINKFPVCVNGKDEVIGSILIESSNEISEAFVLTEITCFKGTYPALVDYFSLYM